MLTALLVVVVVMLGVIALLAVPLTLSFRVAAGQAIEHDFRLQWAFGLVRMRIPTEGNRKSPEHSKKEKPDRERSSNRKRNVVAAIRLRRFRRRIMRLIGDLWRAVYKQDVHLRLRVGLGDPAETGQLWAILGPVSGLLANVRDASILIEPEFLDVTLDLDSSGTVRVIPLQIICIVAALLLSPAVWQGWRQIRAAA